MDVKIFRAINDGWRSPIADSFFALLSYSGLGAAVALVAILLLFRRETRIYAFSIGLAAFLGGTVIAQTFKSLIPRNRPSMQSYAHVMEPIQRSSFPSGHTATGFAVATAISILLWRSGHKVWAVAPFVWAFAVGLSRIYRGVHWPSDVFGGALGGIVGGCLAMLMVDAVTKQLDSKRA